MINKDNASKLVTYAKLVQQYAKTGDVKAPTTESKVARQRAGQLLNRLGNYVQRLAEQNASVVLSEKAGDKKAAAAALRAEKATTKAEEKLLELANKFEAPASQPAQKSVKAAATPKKASTKKTPAKKAPAKKVPAKKAAAKTAPVKKAA
jgi:hypothetical protein